MTTTIWIISVTHSNDGDVYFAAARTREELMFALRRGVHAAYADRGWEPDSGAALQFLDLVNAIPTDFPDLDVIERKWPLNDPALTVTLVEVATNPTAEECT